MWVPQLGAKENDVPGGAALVPDKRARHYWDANGALGRAYGRVLRTPDTAWDVYLLYARGVRWTDAGPPAPLFWMHQLGGVTIAPRLDPDVLRQHVEMSLHA